MRLLTSLLALSLFSCISFPRAEHEARLRRQQAAESGSAVVEQAPPVKVKKNFKDSYFR